ncbi:MAG TPA: DUF4404 family protein [Steroidobacteraceae bacterium]|nr:DUF4404 family protein [Steroidobacteraceae bacterium]
MNRPSNKAPEETLRELLVRVHERLHRAEQVDAESHRLLGLLTGDIERALGGGGPQRARVKGESLPRLEELAVRFETEHPALAQVLRQLIDALGKAGI